MHYVEHTDRTGTCRAAIEKLLGALPDAAMDFAGSQYPQPIAMAYLGRRTDVASVRAEAATLDAGAPAGAVETAMLMAEMIEAASPDQERYFQSDARTRGHIFTGSKWRSGWVFIMGGGDPAELAGQFKRREFLIFAQNGAGLDGVIDLGPRETAAAYFMQVMVRYAMIWGGLAPGDDHEMGHFLERDMPGVVVANGNLTPVEDLLLLGLMKMGAPAVVSSEYPWELGRFVRAEGTDAIVEAAAKFPNLRVKDIEGRTVTLPDNCNPANAKTEFEPAGLAGGKNSFFLLRPADAEAGISLPGDTDLTGIADVGFVIEIGDRRLDVPTSEYMERIALGGIDAMAGFRAQQTASDGFVIRFAKGVKPDASVLARGLQQWVQYQFPYIENVRVTVLTGEAAAEARQRAAASRQERAKMIAAESDDTVDSFNYCLECQPFAKDHICIVTPDRPPMCGRDRFQIKSAALFGASWHPWKRRDLEKRKLRGAIPAGRPIDAATGEYATVNRTVKALSPSRIERVQLHALRDFPHTSCGCFQFVAFRTEAMDGLGIMERNYSGAGPGGVTWDTLANAAGGKQTPGVAGVSRNYLRSKRFMQGEGGTKAVRWVSPKAFEAIKDLLSADHNVQVGPP